MLAAIVATAQDNPLWMRFSAISPDGQTIAFSYKGDLFTVPTSGGSAHQLTSNAAYDAYPVWSPDGQDIAFASAREGSLDVYIINKDGGAPKRLTTYSGNETPLCFMQDLDLNANGDILYHDIKGYEDPFRKHHTSSITRDVWLKKDGKFTKLTTFNGEDRTPRWAPDGKSYYYLSEQDGTFNVYKNSVGGQATQLTHHKGNPVRFHQRVAWRQGSGFCDAWRRVCDLGGVQHHQTGHQHTRAGAHHRFLARRTQHRL